MVAASKVRKAQFNIRHAPYAERIAKVVSHVASSNTEYKHSYLVRRGEVKRAGIIAVSTDRGLCGGLNTNMFKQALNHIADLDDQGIGIEVVTFGNKAQGFFKRIGAKVVATATHLGDTPEMAQVIGPVQVLLDPTGRRDRRDLPDRQRVRQHHDRRRRWCGWCRSARAR